MNTVMDDNKMLTLASNERIPLTPSMRLLLEINHMNHCSPATVSRGGVIFVNVDDVGWKPVVDSWIEKLEVSNCSTNTTFHARLLHLIHKTHCLLYAMHASSRSKPTCQYHAACSRKPLYITS
jgi:hypothetical protein